MHHILREPAIRQQLEAIDRAIAHTAPSAMPALLAELPLNVFAALLHDLPEEFPQVRAWGPIMATDDVQKQWTGRSGYPLLMQSTAFIQALIQLHARHGGKRLEASQVLDFGVGWGRLLRLLLKYVSSEHLFAVDAWPHSLAIAKDLRLPGRIELVSEYPTALPFDEKFDLVFAFSVFTHLSFRAMSAAAAAIRSSIAADGLLVVTIRPAEYWLMAKTPGADDLVRQHHDRGFAFRPHNRAAIDGDVPFGDASMSIEWMRREWKGWRVVEIEFGLIDPYQLIVALKPA